MDITKQASLASTSWCGCAKCTPMLVGIECQCCKEIKDISERMANNGTYNCIIIEHSQFKVVCLNKEVLFTVLVMMNMIRGDPLTLPLPNTNRYATVKVCVVLTFVYTP